MKQIVYSPLSYQRTFHFSRKPKAYLSAGYGAGKTYSLCMKGFDLMSQNQGLAGGILAPSLKMFKRDVLPTIIGICQENGIEYTYNKSDSVFYFPDAKATIYIFHSEDDGASIRGPNLAWGLINEVTMCSKPAFDAFLARIRLKEATLLQVAMSGTPEGFNWAYDYFIEEPRPDTELVFGNTRENKHLAGSYVETLEASYDKLMQERYIDGRFVNLTGNRAAYSFDRFKHVKPGISRIPGAPVWVSLDFNVTPMAATLWNRLPIDSPYLLQSFEDIRLDSSDTYEMARVIRDKVGIENVTIYPDPAGAARSTKASGKTDITILRDAGFLVKHKPSIRSVRDCMNAVNNLFDKGVILIGDRCKNIIADLEQVTFKTNTFELDKSNINRTHWLDGFKDMIDYEFPIRRPQTTIGVRAYA